MDDLDDFGPAMRELSEQRRLFVMAIVDVPGITFKNAAIKAGYSNHLEAAKVAGHRLAHSPVVQAAIREEAGKRLNAMSLTAANVMMTAMTSKKVPIKERLKAAAMLLDRTGFGAMQTINVNKTTTDRTGKAIMDRLQELAKKHGIDAVKLLEGPEAIEAQFTEVTTATEAKDV